MKPSQIKIKKGKLVPQIKGGIVSLAKLLGSMGIASIKGAVAVNETPDGLVIFVHPGTDTKSRLALVTGSTGVVFDERLTLSAVTHDIDEAMTTALLCTVAGDVVTLKQSGLYHLSYSAVIKLDLGGSETYTPEVVEGSVVIRAGGTSVPTSEGKSSALRAVNLTGFVTNPDSSIEQQVSLGGATGKTEPLTPVSLVTCDSITGTVVFDEYGQPTGEVTITNACANAISTLELDGANQLDVTLDNADIDVGTSLEVITTYTPTAEVYATVSGQALVRVKRNSSGVLKIFVGATELSPTIDLYGTATGGTVTGTTASLSISFIP